MKDDEKRRRYAEAVEVFLRKKAELGGRMPLERDFEGDAAVNVKQLIIDLEAKSFAEAAIKVVQEVRRREGRPDRLYIKRNEKEIQEELEIVAEMVKEDLAEKEVTKMAEKKMTWNRKWRYTYGEIWTFAKEYNLAERSDIDIRSVIEENRGPILPTIHRFLGKKCWWARQLAAETPEEGQEILKQLEEKDAREETLFTKATKEVNSPVIDDRAETDIGVLPGLKILTIEDLNTMLKEGGVIDILFQTSERFSVTWDAAIYVGDNPIEITIRARKT